ncbi:MAG: ABC transporter permease [Verrucomicrobiota bacterium]|nr:ABC transporter permease [Verrucomicrobiota bacterium]
MRGESARWFRTKYRRLFRRGKVEAALDAELQFHLDQLTAEFRAEGLSEHDARLAAQREFGAEASAYREEIRDTWRPPELADLWRSLRFAVRSLARSPGFTTLAIATLALGIGANTAMFSALNSILLKPLPYPESRQLDQFYRATALDPRGNFSGADYLDLQAEMAGYGEVAAIAPGDVSLAQTGQPADFAAAVRASANLFSTLGMHPQFGRDFRADEARSGNDRVLIISHRCWQNRFGGEADIIGRIVRVNGEPHEIIGVMPLAFNDWRHLGWVDLFRPLGLTKEEATDRKTQFLQLVGRRATSRSPAEAESIIGDFGKCLAADFSAHNAGSIWQTLPLEEAKLGDSPGPVFTMLICLSGFVLLIACSNLANLLLARTMARAREFAVRSALGASGRQLLRPLIAESLLLAVAGGSCAILVAAWGTDWLSAASTGSNGEHVPIALDWRVLAWACGASLVTAFAFGIASALFAVRLNVNETLKSGARGMTGSRGHQRFRSVLIGGQFALAMILLTGAALFIRGLDDLNNRRSGWESDRLVTGTILLPDATDPGPEEITAFQHLALERLRSLPGVASASLSYTMPFFGLTGPRKYLVEGRPSPKAGDEPAADFNGVSPRYFETVGTRLIAGRAFNEHDTTESPKVFIINETMAHALFGNEDPIGRRITQASSDTPAWGQVVGVAADVRSIFPEPHPVTFQLYQPMAQEPRPYNEIAVRTAGVAPATLIESIRGVMTSLNPDLPVRNLQPADQRIERRNYQLGVLSSMLSALPYSD